MNARSLTDKVRHSGEGRNPVRSSVRLFRWDWIPAPGLLPAGAGSAGMTGALTNAACFIRIA